MDHRPVAIDTARQQSGILIFRRHDDAQSFKAPEIFGKREGDAWAAARKRGIRYRILFELWDIGDAWIFDSPDFFRVSLRMWHKRGLTIDPPPVNSIGRA